MTTNIPWELIEDILRRLPVKSLKRFRCVAKSWCFLIDSDNFVKLHLNRSLLTNSHRKLILGGLGLYSIDLDSPEKAKIIKPPFYYKSSDSVSNSINGLILVMSEPPVLWNPFSAEYKVLPGVRSDFPGPLDSYSKTSFGFGYDSGNDDYKVIRVVEYRDTTTHFWLSSETQIYGLRSKKWRKIESFPYQLPFLKGNWRVHVNGALHTLVEEPYVMHTAKIMAFDVSKEKHSELMMPPGIRLREVDVNLDVLGDCLSVVCVSKSRVVMWVMKEYGVKESWMKLLTISPPAIERNDFVKPLLYSKDGGKVLLNCDDKRLSWYDLKTKNVENVSVDGIPFVFYAEVCVESLVRIDDGSDVKKPGLEKKKEKKERKPRKTGNNNRDDFLSEGFKLVL